VDTNPEAMARFVLQQWQKQAGAVVPEARIATVTQLNTEFQSEELDGDNVLLLEGPEGPLYLIEVEFQSTLHPFMPLRSLEYCARAKKKHWKTYGDLPILAAVIYLFDDKNMPVPPLQWTGPNGQTTLLFYYLSIQMKELPRRDLLALGEPALWPLVLLTEGQVDRILVEEMFRDLLDHQCYQTLPIGHVVAAWLLRGEDLDWLNKEYQKMYELFEDSPAIQWIEESGRQKERKIAEQRVLEERRKAEEERKKMVATLRQAVVELVAQRFPTLKRLAKAQVRLLDQTERFPQVLLRLSQAHDFDETQEVLLSLLENDDAGHTPEAL
jgi:hypothetical protein